MNLGKWRCEATPPLPCCVGEDASAFALGKAPVFSEGWWVCPFEGGAQGSEAAGAVWWVSRCPGQPSPRGLTVALQKHIKEHHEEVRERPCPHPGCNKVFMIDRYLQRHVKLIHTGASLTPHGNSPQGPHLVLFVGCSVDKSAQLVSVALAAKQSLCLSVHVLWWVLNF